MKYKLLRAARILVALFVFLGITAFFLSDSSLLPAQLALLAKIQFVPSVLSLFAGGFIVFAALVVATFFFGRVYCSVVCPLGILQDVVSWFARHLKRFAPSGAKVGAKPKEAQQNAQDAAQKSAAPKPKKKFRATRNYRFMKNPVVVRILFFVFALASTFCGGAYLGLIEPYGAFGRIAVNVFKPIYHSVGNILYAILSRCGVYSIDYVAVRPESWGALVLGIASFVVLLIFAGFWGRLYCNSVCPVGTFLGFLSKFAFFKTRIDSDRCIGCGLCAKACKSSCIDVVNKKVDSTRCVVCFDCFNACRKGAISYSADQRPQLAPNDAETPNGTLDEATLREKERVAREIRGFDRSKREFVALTALATTAAVAKVAFGDDEKAPSADAPETTANDAAAPTNVEAKPEDYGLTPFTREHTISPPGSISHKRFQSLCVGCHLCVSKCPSHVLKPSGLENGFAGLMQPRVEFSHGFCNYDCVTCGEVCPTGAILPLKPEAKKLVQTGHVVFIKENCIVYAQNTSCGACSEHCPTQAVRMVPYNGDLTIPETNVELCVGCGGCEYICPARPFRAIYVEGHTEHQEAKPVEKAEVKEVENVDFGF